MNNIFHVAPKNTNKNCCFQCMTEHTMYDTFLHQRLILVPYKGIFVFCFIMLMFALLVKHTKENMQNVEWDMLKSIFCILEW